MTVNLRLAPDIEKDLLAEAHARGLSPDELIEALVREFAKSGSQLPQGDASASMVKLEDGMWAICTGHPLSAATVNETIDTLRREGELRNSGISR